MSDSPETVMIFGDGKKILGRVLNRRKHSLLLICRVIKFLANLVYLKPDSIVL